MRIHSRGFSGATIVKRGNGQHSHGSGLSFIVGGLLGVCLVLIVGAVNDPDSPGQCQCCTAGDDSSAVFVLDTETGDVWLVGRADTVDFGTPFDRTSVRKSMRPVVQ